MRAIVHWSLAVWAGLVSVIIIHALLHGTLGSNEYVLVGLIIVHVVVTITISALSLRPGWTPVIAIAVSLRILVLLLDQWTQVSIPFMGDGGDAAGFYSAAVTISEDPSKFGETYGGMYTALVGALFILTGPYSLLAQYVNVLLGVTTVLLSMGVVAHVTKHSKASVLGGLIVATMPSSVIHSATLLREALIQCLVAFSIIFFVRWLQNRRSFEIVIAVLYVLSASIFHAGVVGLLLGYAVAILTSAGGAKNRAKTVLSGVVIVAAGAVAVLRSPDLFLGKFQSLDDVDDLIESQNRRAGGAAYLTEFQIDSWLEFFLFAPLRAVYFIASPVPMDWRGFGDVLAFGLDSAWYLAVIWLAWRNRAKLTSSPYMLPLSIVLVSTVLMFGAGVSNAGTALRHRTKLVPVFVALAASTRTQGLRNDHKPRVHENPVWRPNDA